MLRWADEPVLVYGYSLLLGGGIWITPLLQKTTWGGMRDFAPIAAAARVESIRIIVPSRIRLAGIRVTHAHGRGASDLRDHRQRFDARGNIGIEVDFPAFFEGWMLRPPVS